MLNCPDSTVKLIHKDNAQHDPADREEAVTGAIDRRRSGKTGWHMKGKDGGEQGRANPASAA